MVMGRIPARASGRDREWKFPRTAVVPFGQASGGVLVLNNASKLRRWNDVGDVRA